MKKVGEKFGQFKKRPYLCGAKPERAEHAAAGKAAEAGRSQGRNAERQEGCKTGQPIKVWESRMTGKPGRQAERELLARIPTRRAGF